MNELFKRLLNAEVEKLTENQTLDDERSWPSQATEKMKHVTEWKKDLKEKLERMNTREK